MVVMFHEHDEIDLKVCFLVSLRCRCDLLFRLRALQQHAGY